MLAGRELGEFFWKNMQEILRFYWEGGVQYAQQWTRASF